MDFYKEGVRKLHIGDYQSLRLFQKYMLKVDFPNNYLNNLSRLTTLIEGRLQICYKSLNFLDFLDSYGLLRVKNWGFTNMPQHFGRDTCN